MGTDAKEVAAGSAQPTAKKLKRGISNDTRAVS